MRLSSLRASCFAIIALMACAGFLAADNGPQHQAKQTPPIQLGTSGGNIMDISARYCCSGTLGALVSWGGGTYILSNNHVLGRSDQAKGDEDISQPGLVDVNCNSANANIVAHFTKAIELRTANVDAAIAAAGTGMVKPDGSILDIGVPANTIVAAAVGMAVAKSGRTTGLTCSSIKAVNTNVNVQYETGCGTGSTFIVSYRNQVMIQDRKFSAGGDSGSLIVKSSTAQPAALLFAGSSTTTIGNPIGDVVTAFGGPGGFSFVGSSQHAVTCPAGGKPPKKSAPAASDIERARNAKERHAGQLMADPAVQGVGVGAAEDNDSEAVVVIYVEIGRPHPLIPTHLDGVRTEIISTGRFRAYGWNEALAPGACSSK